MKYNLSEQSNQPKPASSPLLVFVLMSLVTLILLSFPAFFPIETSLESILNRYPWLDILSIIFVGIALVVAISLARLSAV